MTTLIHGSASDNSRHNRKSGNSATQSMVLTVRIPSFSAPGSGAVHRSTLRYGLGNNDLGLRDVEGVFAIPGHVSQPPLVHSGLCWRGEIWISAATITSIAMGSKLLQSRFMSSSTLLL